MLYRSHHIGHSENRDTDEKTFDATQKAVRTAFKSRRDEITDYPQEKDVVENDIDEDSSASYTDEENGTTTEDSNESEEEAEGWPEGGHKTPHGLKRISTALPKGSPQGPPMYGGSEQQGIGGLMKALVGKPIFSGAYEEDLDKLRNILDAFYVVCRVLSRVLSHSRLETTSSTSDAER